MGKGSVFRSMACVFLWWDDGRDFWWYVILQFRLVVKIPVNMVFVKHYSRCIGAKYTLWSWDFSFLLDWLVLSDEQMSKRWPFSLLNDEQMSNWLGVEHLPVDLWTKNANSLWPSEGIKWPGMKKLHPAKFNSEIAWKRMVVTFQGRCLFFMTWYCWWFRNPANHLTSMKPCKELGYLPYQLVSRISSINSSIDWILFSSSRKSLRFHPNLLPFLLLWPWWQLWHWWNLGGVSNEKSKREGWKCGNTLSFSNHLILFIATWALNHPAQTSTMDFSGPCRGW